MPTGPSLNRRHQFLDINDDWRITVVELERQERAFFNLSD